MQGQIEPCGRDRQTPACRRGADAPAVGSEIPGSAKTLREQVTERQIQTVGGHTYPILAISGHSTCPLP